MEAKIDSGRLIGRILIDFVGGLLCWAWNECTICTVVNPALKS